MKAWTTYSHHKILRKIIFKITSFLVDIFLFGMTKNISAFRRLKIVFIDKGKN